MLGDFEMEDDDKINNSNPLLRREMKAATTVQMFNKIEERGPMIDSRDNVNVRVLGWCSLGTLIQMFGGKS